MTARAPEFAAVAVALAALLAGCAPLPAAPRIPARLSVEVIGGFAEDELVPLAELAPVAVLVDSTASMARGEAGAADHARAARRAAARLVEGLSDERRVWLYAMGAETAGNRCRPPVLVGRAESEPQRRLLLDRLSRLRGWGESDLAASLDTLRAELEPAETAGARVVVFSDLSNECGGDLCAAAARLVEAGARLDVVVIGARPVPACLEGLEAPVPEAPLVARQRAPVHYRLELRDPSPVVVGCSDAGGTPVAAPVGPATVVVELDPPMRIDGHFVSGRDYLLQILDFPSLEPHTRRWRWQDAPLDTGEARR